MNANINCGIKGQYKVDIYSGRTLVETTDWFSNDITNYGMNYPFIYPFAQCFMFLSIGSDVYDTVNNNPHTGLKSPIGSFKVYNEKSGIHYQSGEYIGWQGYEIGVEHENGAGYPDSATACGSKITKNGVNLYRGWSIPTGNIEDGTVVAEPGGLNINQFMVSPSSGKDEKGNKAFSLVDRNILIPSGYSAIVTYQLSINFKDYESIQFFSGKNVEGTNGYFSTGNAETGIGGSEIELLNSWTNLSGIYRLIFPAIQLIDDVGACISPKIGYDLEPSVVDSKKTRFYLSPDISQFMVSKSGEIPTGEFQAYNENGLMGNYSEIYRDIVIQSTPSKQPFNEPDKWFYSGDSLSQQSNEETILENIRLSNIPSISNYNSGDLVDLSYKTSSYIGAKNYPVAFATPGKLGFNYSYSDYGQRAVFSSYLRRLPVNPSLKETGAGTFQRYKYVTKKAVFAPLYSYGTNSRYGSLVLGRNTNVNQIENATFYPYLDFLFFDSEGRASNMAHYRYIPYIYLEDRGRGLGKVIFSITGENGSKPDSINRFYSAYGFMGNGVSTLVNSSGLNENHPKLEVNIIDNNSSFIPVGNKASGFLFGGQVLNENISGDIHANNGTGVGAVYGIIANTGFYLKNYDICLLDKPDWTGFGNPNPSGYASRLCWPSHKNKIGLKIEAGYFLTGSGIIDDPQDYFAAGTGQIIQDIIIKGPIADNNKSFLNSAVSNNFYLSDDGVTKLSYSTAQSVEPFILKIFDNINSYNISFDIKDVGGYALIDIEKFNNNFNLSRRGSGSGLNLVNASANEIRIYDNTLTNEYEFIDNAPTPNTGNLYIVPTDFKKPIGHIYHLESGYRMLPNYAIANTGNINTYLPVTGGSFPGLSTENGMEIYLTLSWNSE